MFLFVCPPAFSPAGFYCPTAVTLVPILCPVGHYCEEGSAVPTACVNVDGAQTRPSPGAQKNSPTSPYPSCHRLATLVRVLDVLFILMADVCVSHHYVPH